MYFSLPHVLPTYYSFCSAVTFSLRGVCGRWILKTTYNSLCSNPLQPGIPPMDVQ